MEAVEQIEEFAMEILQDGSHQIGPFREMIRDIWVRIRGCNNSISLMPREANKC